MTKSMPSEYDRGRVEWCLCELATYSTEYRLLRVLMARYELAAAMHARLGEVYDELSVLIGAPDELADGCHSLATAMEQAWDVAYATARRIDSVCSHTERRLGYSFAQPVKGAAEAAS